MNTEPAEWAACRKRTAEEARGIVQVKVERGLDLEEMRKDQQKYVTAVLDDK